MTLDPDFAQVLLDACESSIQAGSRSPYDYFNRGNALADLGRHEEAVRDYETVIALDPRYDEAAGMPGAAWFNRGNSLMSLGRFVDAAASYGNVPTHGADGDDADDARLRQVSALIQAERTDEALAVLDAMLARTPNAPRFVAQRAFVLARGGRLGEALAVIDEDYVRTEDGAQAPLVAADLLAELGHTAEAMARLDAAGDAFQSDPMYWLSRARVAAKQDDAVAALAAAARVLAMQPAWREDVLAEFVAFESHDSWAVLAASEATRDVSPARTKGASGGTRKPTAKKPAPKKRESAKKGRATKPVAEAKSAVKKAVAKKPVAKRAPAKKAAKKPVAKKKPAAKQKPVVKKKPVAKRAPAKKKPVAKKRAR